MTPRSFQGGQGPHNFIHPAYIGAYNSPPKKMFPGRMRTACNWHVVAAGSQGSRRWPSSSSFSAATKASPWPAPHSLTASSTELQTATSLANTSSQQVHFFVLPMGAFHVPHSYLLQHSKPDSKLNYGHLCFPLFFYPPPLRLLLHTQKGPLPKQVSHYW